MPKRLTQREFEERVLNKLGPEYRVLGKYINKETKIEMEHFACGNKFLKKPGDVMQKGSGCPFCCGNKKALYTEQWVQTHTPLPYHYVTGYLSMSKKCTFHCDKCNTDFLQTPGRLINQKIFGCGCCPTKRKTHDEFLRELGEECLKEYEVLDEYDTIDKKINFKHKPCQTIFKLSPYQFITRHNKQYCPLCYFKKSKGELSIANFLEVNEIDYQKEFVFPDLPKRFFDFFLPQDNSVIEYDGEQHFFAVDFFGGEEALQATKKRDQEKNQYCLTNNIKVYRIPYYDYDNINQILHEIYKEKSSTTIEKYRVTE